MRKEYIKPEIESIVINGGRLLGGTSLGICDDVLEDNDQVGVKGNILWDFDEDDWYD